MRSRDRLLAVLVAVVWGLNFPATALALEHFPPFLLAAVRFTLLAVPTVLFVPRPRMPFGRLLLVGTGLGVLQFAFLYLGMAAGLPSGLASLVLQASAPFTVVLAGVFLRERLTGRQVVGVTIAVAALAAIAVHRAQAAALVPVVLALCGALGWAIGNVATRRAGPVNPLHLTLWWSIVPPVPMAVLALLVEGPERVGTALGTAFTAAALPADLGLLYIVLVASLVGYGIWSRLLGSYPSSTVAPFSMLVPVVGVLASWVAFGEVPDVVEVVAGAVVVAAVLWSSRTPRVVPTTETVAVPPHSEPAAVAGPEPLPVSPGADGARR
ncbi:EamA family transporter [Curtobacterium sp. Csp1]|uniref:EamA family transporter n=1 Tax=unclassified Curtobacterium TaxID=257496 RepID=UPI00159A178D|nr:MULTISPECIES: EamA family transporter [unclassified Curtobacterium]QKS12609.1 EamA family transporter [Curtobacterium sp. csp3]QKS20226.1 EamA family transporter [Curtobacterium sp. Csp1]